MGYVHTLPNSRIMLTRSQFLDIICTHLAGRAAENIILGSHVSGSSSETKELTQIVYGLVRDYGMNERIGPMGFGRARLGERKYSESTAEVMDEEVRSIIDEAYKRTIQLLTEKREQVGDFLGNPGATQLFLAVM